MARGHEQRPNTPPGKSDGEAGAGLEALAAVAYFAVYFGYLFLNQEGELAHWVTLVALPFALICLLQRLRARRLSLRACLASIGLRRGNLSTGLAWAVLIGLALSVLQTGVSRYRTEVLDLLATPRAFLIFPLTFVLMALTAGFTEEFFFRGVLQARLARALRSRAAGVVAAAQLFG